MSYYVKSYEFDLMSRDQIADHVSEYAVEGSDPHRMVDAMEGMAEDYKLFEIPMCGAPNVFIPRDQPISMGGMVGEKVEPVTLYLFKWGPRGDRSYTLYIADDNEQAREIGQNVVEALTVLNRGQRPEEPSITPGGPIPDRNRE